MSQVLVSPPPIPPLAMTSMMEVERPRSQQQLQLHAVNLAGDVGTASIEEKRAASQLAYLASQHHTSEYNRLKFGPGGAPVMYIPLSIQLPAHVRELKARQAHSAHKKVWWPADVPEEMRNGNRMDVDPTQNHSPNCKVDPPQQENVAPCVQGLRATEAALEDAPLHLNKPAPPLNHSPAVNLQCELSAAMSSPLSIITIPQLSPQATFQQPNLNLYAKTSESHPINISPIIPFELLPLISSHLSPTPPHAPYMFELLPSLFLHHIAVHSSLPPSDTMRTYPIVRVPNGGLTSQQNGIGPPTPDSLSPSAWTKSFSNGMPEPAALAVNSSNFIGYKHDEESRVSMQTLARTGIQPGNPPALEQNYPKDPFISSEASLVPPPTQNRPHSAPPLLLSSSAVPPNALATGIAAVSPPMPELVHAMSSDILSNGHDGGKSSETITSSHNAGDVTPPVTWALNLAPSFVPPLQPALGNMLLSSCPGKKGLKICFFRLRVHPPELNPRKVRLSGPVKGRGAICRDLGHDLRRVRALGVGCIICCLDDEELEFLGASWPQYSEIARTVGLDVLRIPIPEGLAPPTPALLDQHLSYIIRAYTLKGVPVLVHCRGGVGRAGLVACCWMLKLGLCGWLSPAVDKTNGYDLYEHDGEVVKVRRETVELVERVIAVVRRRRSVKAIETYEQVRFLVEFVEHLLASGVQFT